MLNQTKNKNEKKDTDESVQRMVKNWDKVRCHYCGKRISMLNAKLIKGNFFVCKEH